MSGSGEKGVQEATARAKWERYQEVTLREIKFHRASAWTVLKYGILVSGGIFLSAATIILEFSDAREVPCRVDFAAIFCSVVFLVYGYYAWEDFKWVRKLTRKLDEHIDRVRECEKNADGHGDG